VTAAFYPLEYIAAGVGADSIDLRTITAPGIEPHDLELSPAAVREMRESDVVVYIEGFQPAVDAAVAEMDDALIINVADHIEFREAEEHDDEDGHSEEEEEEAHEDDDPHFWLDPAVYSALAPVLAEAFADLDSHNAADYETRSQAVVDDLLALDEQFATSLAQCERNVIVVGHEAFGYMTDAYGLEQVGLAGLSPDAEPSPARIREVREVAEHEGVTTIYFETLVSSAVSDAFASDLGLGTTVLDPIEGITDDNDDYRSVMERNLDALVEGLDCQ
jgi:zinc transport system substrate-binding protein